MQLIYLNIRARSTHYLLSRKSIACFLWKTKKSPLFKKTQDVYMNGIQPDEIPNAQESFMPLK